MGLEKIPHKNSLQFLYHQKLVLFKYQNWWYEEGILHLKVIDQLLLRIIWYFYV